MSHFGIINSTVVDIKRVLFTMFSLDSYFHCSLFTVPYVRLVTEIRRLANIYLFRMGEFMKRKIGTNELSELLGYDRRTMSFKFRAPSATDRGKRMSVLVV